MMQHEASGPRLALGLGGPGVLNTAARRARGLRGCGETVRPKRLSARRAGVRALFARLAAKCPRPGKEAMRGAVRDDG